MEAGLEKIIAIGGSAGALEVLSEILPHCTHKDSLPMVVVLHIGSNLSGAIPQHLQKLCSATVKEAEPNEPLRRGHIYFAPPGYHLLVSPNGECELNVDDPVMYSRPSIDVLFESVAEFYGDRATGIVLSGANADGSKGLRKLEEKNAQIVVQNPETAMFSEMPESAIASTQRPIVLDTHSICDFLNGSAKWL